MRYATGICSGVLSDGSPQKVLNVCPKTQCSLVVIPDSDPESRFSVPILQSGYRFSPV